MSSLPSRSDAPLGGIASPALPTRFVAWFARRALAATLARTGCGQIVVHLPDGSRLEARGTQPGPEVVLEVLRWRTLARLAWQGDIGLAESFRDGHWTTPGLVALLEFGARNGAAMGDRVAGTPLSRALARLVHRLRDNTRRRARQNISAHYDLGNAFYARWLDPTMTYSSALYDGAATTLEAAQVRKLDRVMELLDLRETSSVLELGCGWGALACALVARHPGARVTGLTLSSEQLAFARARATATNLDPSIDLRLQDYRDVEGTFDRIVSIEMIEAVGEAFWPTYFQTLRARLAAGGTAVIQAITIDDAAFATYRRGCDFIQRFIFPGGMLPSPSTIRAQADAAGLRVESVESFGPSYARTLADWRARFEAEWPRIAALGFDDAFRRLWLYYLAYCEAGFRTGRVDVGLWRLQG